MQTLPYLPQAQVLLGWGLPDQETEARRGTNNSSTQAWGALGNPGSPLVVVLNSTEQRLQQVLFAVWLCILAQGRGLDGCGGLLSGGPSRGWLPLILEIHCSFQPQGVLRGN